MAPNDQKTDVVPPLQEVREDLPPASRSKSHIFLGESVSVTCGAGGRLCRERNRVAIGLFAIVTQAPAASSAHCAYWSGCTCREYSRRCY